MPINRYYSTSETITGEEFSHLKVTRQKVGDQIELIDGKGRLSVAHITKMGKKEAEVSIDSTTIGAKEPTAILAQAIPRLNRLDTILEKGTELGATSFWLFPGDLSEKKELTPTQKERCSRIVINATKQCSRLYLPTIEWKPPLGQWDLPCPAYFGDLEGEPINERRDLIFIGPESGFSDRELGWLKEQAMGVRLHQNVLRTDTAAIVGLYAASKK